MGKLYTTGNRLIDNSDPMLLTQTASSMWATPRSNTTGFSLQLIGSNDSATLELSGPGDEGGYVYLDTDDITSLIEALTTIRDDALAAQKESSK